MKLLMETCKGIRCYLMNGGMICIEDKLNANESILLHDNDILNLADIIYEKRIKYTTDIIKRRNKEIVELRTKGHWTYERIAKAYSLTRQGVHCIVKNHNKGD